jgi:hypothetical protein
VAEEYTGKLALRPVVSSEVALEEVIWHEHEFTNLYDDPETAHPWWRQAISWLILAALLGVIVGLIVWYFGRDNNYHSVLQSNASWIEHQSKLQEACFADAKTANDTNICAEISYQAVQSHAQSFESIKAPNHFSNAFSTLQNAYAALEVATCYDPGLQTSDAACISSMKVTLRAAVLNAQDALH